MGRPGPGRAAQRPPASIYRGYRPGRCPCKTEPATRHKPLTYYVNGLFWRLLDFEWDDAKNLSNQRKHGLSFSEVTELFQSGGEYFEIFDQAHSES